MVTPSISASQLRKKLLLYLAAGSLVLAVALCTAIFLPVYERLKQAEGKRVLHAVQIRAMAVDEWVRRARDLARQVTSRTRIRQELEKYNAGAVTRKNLGAFTTPKLDDAMASSKMILGIIRLDIRGREVSRCGMRIPKDKWPEAGKKSGSVTASYPFVTAGLSTMVLRTTIVSRKGKAIGTDLLLVNLCDIRNALFEQEGYGETGSITMAYISGDEFFSALPAMEENRLPAESIVDRVTELAGSQGKGAGAALLHVDGNNVGVAGIQGMDWYLVVTESEAGLYKGLRRRLLVITAVALGGYIVFVLGFYRIMNSLTGRLVLSNSGSAHIESEQTEPLGKEDDTHENERRTNKKKHTRKKKRAKKKRRIKKKRR